VSKSQSQITRSTARLGCSCKSLNAQQGQQTTARPELPRTFVRSVVIDNSANDKRNVLGASFVLRAAPSKSWFRSALALETRHARCRVPRARFCSGDVETSLQDPCCAQFPATEFPQLPVVWTAVSCEPGSLLTVAAGCKRLAEPGIPSSVSLPASAGRQRAGRLELSVSVLSSLALVTGSRIRRRGNVSQLLKPAVNCCSRSPTEKIWPASPRQQKGTFEFLATVRDSACHLFQNGHTGVAYLGLQMAL